MRFLVVRDTTRGSLILLSPNSRFGGLFVRKIKPAGLQPRKIYAEFHNNAPSALAVPAELESATSDVTGRRSNQLNYGTI